MSEDTDCIHYVKRGDPKFLFHCGATHQRHRLPPDTRVIYPRPPLEGIRDFPAAVRDAVNNPLGTDPLAARLRPGLKVTIAFDDLSLPLPPMRRPDVRQTVIEEVVKILDAHGVTDVHLICAICLHRRMTPGELKRILGRRIYNRYAPDRLYNHDAEDPERNVFLGKTEQGEEVEVNKRAMESDLLIYVNINLVSMDGGHKSVAIGLGTYRSVRHHHCADMMLHDSSYMDPPQSAFHRSCERQGALVNKQVDVFTIETTLNSDTFPHWTPFLQKREREWSFLDRSLYESTNVTLHAMPANLRRRFLHALPAPYSPTGVHAGRTDPVHAKTLELVHEQQTVCVNGQCDIVIYGVPYIGPYNVYSIMNPILVNVMTAGYFFNFALKQPIVKQGGVMIVLHPFENRFHKVHHPSYIDFFNDLLPQTRDPHELQHRFERDYAEKAEYIDKYRHGYAYHGVHPFYMWYWACRGQAYLGKMIAVAPQSRLAAERVGFDVAPSLDAAIGMAREYLGDSQAEITYYHNPPIFMTEVNSASVILLGTSGHTRQVFGL